MSSAGGKRRKRAYSPTVEALEALKLLSGGAATLPLPAADLAPLDGPDASPAPPLDATWDSALAGVGSVDSVDLLAVERAALRQAPAADARSLQAGFDQLDRYLARAWYRAGIDPQAHDDCTQAVYMTLLQGLGRDRFDALVGDVGQLGVREVLSRETAEGPDFFRAVDMVKKRAQRERSFQPLDERAAVADRGTVGDDPGGDLREAILHALSPREAALVWATLQGETPAEIASQWGVAPKTVSNEKTRALQKLRDALAPEPGD